MYGNLGWTQFIQVVIMAGIPVFAFWKILGRMGYSPWLSLLVMVPVINGGLFLYIAYAKWPRV